MGTNLAQEIERIRAMENARNLNERTVQTALVLPILRTLGWDTADPDEVSMEHSVASRLKGKADIVLLAQNKPLTVIETKASQMDLMDSKNLAQLSDYCRMLESEIGILTNGVEWHFYIRCDRNAAQELADKFDLIDMDTDYCEIKFQTLLSRDKVSDEGARKYARQAWLKNTIAREWKKLLAGSDPALVRRLKRAVRESTNSEFSKAELAEVENFIKEQASPVNQAKPGPTPESKPPARKPQAPRASQTPSQRVTHIQAFGEQFEVKSWRKAALAFLDRMHQEHPEVFNIFLEDPHPKGHFHIVKSVGGQPERGFRQVGTSDWWVGLHLSSTDIRKRCRRLLETSGLPQDNLRFYCDGEVIEEP